jgi:hypothetical protein
MNLPVEWIFVLLVISSADSGHVLPMSQWRGAVVSMNSESGVRHNIKIDSKSFERVEEITYLGATLTGRNSIHE